MSGEQSKKLRSWIYSFIIAILFTAFCVQQTLVFGRYAYPIGADDIAYLSDAMSRLIAWEGGLSFLSQHIASPPHSPVYSYLSILGFIFIGYLDWIPLVLCGIFLVIACQRIFISLQHRFIASLAVALLFLSFPLCRYIVTHLRPDYVTGLTLGYGGLLFVQSRWLEYPKKQWFVYSALFGFAILLKPAYSPVSLALLGVAIACSILKAGVHNILTEPLKICKLLLIAIGGMLIVVLPHFFWAWRNVFEYIYINLLGKHSAIWHLPMSKREQLLYYINGIGGQEMIGDKWYLMAIILCVAAFMAIIKKDKIWIGNFIAYTFYILSAYAIVSATTYMSPHLGAAFHGSLIVGTISSFIYILNRVNIKFQYIIALITIIYCIQYAIRPPYIEYDVYNKISSLRYKRSMTQLTNDVQFIFSEKANILVPISDREFFSQTLEYELLKRYSLPLNISGLNHVKDLDIALASVNNADAVIMLQNTTIKWLPVLTIASDIEDAIKNNPQFIFFKEYPLGRPDSSLMLYIKKDSIRGFSGLPLKINGLAPEEGPYPQWQLPKVRWAKEKESFLQIPPSSRARRLILEVAPAAADTHVTVAIDGELPSKIFLPTPYQFVREEIIIPPTVKDTFVHLIFSEPPKDILPNRVLFKSLILVPEPLQSISQSQ